MDWIYAGNTEHGLQIWIKGREFDGEDYLFIEYRDQDGRMICTHQTRSSEDFSFKKIKLLNELLNKWMNNSSAISKTDRMALEYMNNPDTRVGIYYNNEIGEWRYAVYVDGTDFWLDSFLTEDEAVKFIADNKLVRVS